MATNFMRNLVIQLQRLLKLFKRKLVLPTRIRSAKWADKVAKQSVLLADWSK